MQDKYTGLGFVHLSVQDTIKALELKGLSRKEAIKEVEDKLHITLPPIMKERW